MQDIPPSTTALYLSGLCSAGEWHFVRLLPPQHPERSTQVSGTSSEACRRLHQGFGCRSCKAAKPGRGFAVKCKGGKVILFSGGKRRGGSAVQTSRGASLQSSWQAGVAHHSRKGHSRVGSLQAPNSAGGLLQLQGRSLAKLQEYLL